MDRVLIHPAVDTGTVFRNKMEWVGGALRIEGDPAGAGALKLAGGFGAAGRGIDRAAGEGDAAIHPNDRQAAFAAFPAQLSQDLLRGLQEGKIVDLGLLTGGRCV